MRSALLLILAFSWGCRAAASAEGDWAVDVETGIVSSGYNDARIPGDAGTRFSFTDDLETDSELFFRFVAERRLGARHHLRLLVAPLTLRAHGAIDRPVRFMDEEFEAGERLEGTYRFDSYRLTYRYDLRTGPRLRVGIGFTGKIRDASIRIEGEGRAAEKKNTGFVPLLHARASLRGTDRLRLVLDADALAAPQGRAEDLLMAAEWDAARAVSLRAGYRLLEGGADNDEVYTFTLLHYLVAGATIRF